MGSILKDWLWNTGTLEAHDPLPVTPRYTFSPGMKSKFSPSYKKKLFRPPVLGRKTVTTSHSAPHDTFFKHSQKKCKKGTQADFYEH